VAKIEFRAKYLAPNCASRRYSFRRRRIPSWQATNNKQYKQKMNNKYGVGEQHVYLAISWEYRVRISCYKINLDM